MKTLPITRRSIRAGGIAAVLATAAMLAFDFSPRAPVFGQEKAATSDHTMFGGTVSRNMVNLVDKNVPDRFDPSGPNLLWKAQLGTRSYGGPVMAGGKVFVGTNNENPRNPRDTGKNGVPIDRGIVLCLEEKTGRFLWQSVHPKLPSGQVHDWPREGVCSTPTVQGERVYYVSNCCTVVCADVNGHDSPQPAGIARPGFSGPTDAKLVWEYDMMKELNVSPHNMSACSPLIIGDLMFVVTANGVDGGHITIPSPEAPSFICLNKTTGKLVWKSNLPGKDIMHAQWSNPAYAEVDGVKQVVFPGGDGWLYSFVPGTGELLWTFDCNPKDARHRAGGAESKNDFIGTPVVYNERVYIGTGQDPEHSTGIANFFCIHPTKKGDVSKTLIDGRDKDGKPVNERPNPNSCEVWRYGGEDTRKWAYRDYKFGRTMSTACVVDDVVYIAELAGFLHCLNARTGEHYWQYDTKASVWGSPYYVDGKILLATEGNDLFVFKHEKTHKVYDEIKATENATDQKTARAAIKDVRKQVGDHYLLSKSEFDAPIRTTPVVANGVSYVMTENLLHAFKWQK
jgi:outer membrane protein assembly factor BamB